MTDKLSTATAYAASAGAAGAGWMTLNDFALWVGIVCAIGTAAVNFYFKCKHYQLARENVQARLEDVD